MWDGLVVKVLYHEEQGHLAHWIYSRRDGQGMETDFLWR
jgi:hypothetical protein